MLNILLYAAKKAGTILKDNFRKNIVVSHKTSFKNIVTEVDELSQHVIFETIMDYAKSKGIKSGDIGFIAEEHLQKKGRHLFVVDPIDGTINFASGIDYYGVSIAYFKDKKLASAVVYEPQTDFIYWAEKDKGAYKILPGGKKIKLEIKPTPLKKSILVTYLSSDVKRSKKIYDFMKLVSPHILAIRMFGSTVIDLCRFCDNLYQIVVSPGAFIWDFSAMKLITEESGGILTDWKGKALKLDFSKVDKRYEFLACHPKNLKQMLYNIHHARQQND